MHVRDARKSRRMHAPRCILEMIILNDNLPGINKKMMHVEITGIAKGCKDLASMPARKKGSIKFLAKWVEIAREVGFCKGMPYPIIVEHVDSPAGIKSRLGAFDDVLHVTWYPTGIVNP